MVTIKIWPEVVAGLGSKLPRDAVVVVLNALREKLPALAKHKRRRDPEDPDLFDFVLYLWDKDDTWHTLRFSVNDTQATDHLIIMGFAHHYGRNPPSP